MENILYCAILSQIQKEIKDNREAILEAKNIDNKYCKIKVEEEKLLKIIEYYKTKQNNKLNKTSYIYCNGNPYIVLNLAMIAIMNNNTIKINIDDTMLGVNTILLAIINNVLEKNNSKIKISLFKSEEYIDNVIFIDRINEYNLSKNKIKNIKFIPYQGTDIFVDGEEYDGIFRQVYSYLLEMNIGVDLFEEEGIKGMFKYGDGKIKLIFTNKKEIIEKYKGENIFINENPFKNENIIFDDEMIKEI